jgi:hypothetical protein
MDKVILILGCWGLALATVWIGFVIYLRLRWFKEQEETKKKREIQRIQLSRDREGDRVEKEALIEKWLRNME